MTSAPDQQPLDLALVGGGKIGEALISGLARRPGAAGGIVVVERSPERAAQLVERYGVRSLDLAEAAAACRVLLVAVKPQDVDALLTTLAPH
ncbi:NAD(P)-binding domain-containing protein, partial [Curtobacterium sp. P97]|uniref:pyrroline-5-carboxylate reductase family protein n=1 Tax=Curtobacterium sp. P97 TaxID=2939562 RepID=UPI00203D8477